MLISLFAPWYRESVVARGVSGLETMTLTRTGWSAFGFTEAVVLIVALVALIVLAAAGADRAARARACATIVTALGAIAFVVVLARLITAGTTSHGALSATMTSLRWGIFLALGTSALLSVGGLRLLAGARVPSAPPAAGRVSANAAATRRRAPRSRARPATPRGGPSAMPRRPVRPEPAPVPSSAPQSTSERPRGERARWDDQAGSWLDFPE